MWAIMGSHEQAVLGSRERAVIGLEISSTISAGVTVSFFPSQFFPRGKNGPAHSFPGEKTDRSVFSPEERFD